MPSRSQRRARLCASSRTRTDPSSSTSNAVAPIAGSVRPGSSPTLRRTVAPRRFDDPGSATCRPEHVPAEMHLRRIEEREGPVGRVGSASGHEEALVTARGSKLGVVLEPFAPRSDLRGHRRRQLPDSIVRRRFEQQRTERPMRAAAEMDHSTGGAAALGILDAVGRTVDVVDETNAFARERQERWQVRRVEDARERLSSTGGLRPWRRRLPRATPGCSRPQCLQALRRICDCSSECLRTLLLRCPIRQR